MASRRRDLNRPLLIALCLVAIFAVRSECHGLEDFTGGKANESPDMVAFFGNKPEAAALPEALDSTPFPAKPEATQATPANTVASAAATPRRSVSVAAGVACGIAAIALVGVGVAVAYVVRARRGGRREPEVRLGSP